MNTQKQYVTQIIRIYLSLPDTPNRASSHDHDVASALFANGTPIDMVASALILGTERRRRRNPNSLPLPPIRSLSYFLPIIEELRLYPLSSAYIDYCQHKLSDVISLDD